MKEQRTGEPLSRETYKEACKWYLSNSYQDSPPFLQFPSFLESLQTGLSILAQVSILHGFDTLIANILSILLLVFSAKMRLKSPVKYCRVCWLRGDTFSNFTFGSSFDISILHCGLPGVVFPSSNQKSDWVKKRIGSLWNSL